MASSSRGSPPGREWRSGRGKAWGAVIAAAPAGRGAATRETTGRLTKRTGHPPGAGNRHQGAAEPEHRRARHGRHARHRDRKPPARPKVGAGPDTVHDRHRVHPVRQPVHRPPRSARYPRPHQAGHYDRRQQVQADRTQPEPERLIAGHERDDRGGQADAHVAVSDRAHHMHGHEHHRDQGQVAVQPGHGKPGQSREPPLPVDSDPQQHHRRQQHQ